MPKSHRSNRTGWRHQGGKVFTGAANDNKPRMRSLAPKSDDTQECPVCKRQVKIRKDGTLWAHRVGSSQKQSWPCPGSLSKPDA